MSMINVLKWDAAPRVLAYHYSDCELNYKSQLIVTESQEAVLVKEGQFYGPIGPGRHTLETKNFPFLTKMVSALTTNRKSPYTAEVWFVAKSIPLDLKWGTSDPLLIEDPKYHIALPVRAFGQYGFRIADSFPPLSARLISNFGRSWASSSCSSRSAWSSVSRNWSTLAALLL